MDTATLELLDMISQIGIFIFGLSAVILVSCFKNKWGNVLGLIQQPFWFFTTIHNEQWGLVALTIAFTFVWAAGIWKWFKKEEETSS